MLILYYMPQKLKAYLADLILFHNNRFDSLDFWAISIIERLDQGVWKQFQFRRVRQMLKYAEKNVPYWRKTFKSLGTSPDQIRTINDFTKLPVLTKDTFRSQREEFDPDNWEKIAHTSTTTSGSTGVPLKVKHDLRTSRKQRILYMDYLRRSGLTDFSRFAHFFIQRPNLLTLGFPVGFEAMMRNPDAFCRFLSKSKMQAISGITSILVHIGEWLEQNKINLNLKFIQTAGENLPLPTRKWLESVFHCPVYNRYGCADFGSLGIECENHDGFHINVSHIYLEIADENGNPIDESDTPGKILITTLSNKIMPLFRYDMGDTGQWMSGQCQCGLKTSRIRLYGRELHYLELTGGRKIEVQRIADLFSKYHKLIKKFQIIQESLQKIKICVVATSLHDIQFDDIQLNQYLTEAVCDLIKEESLNIAIERVSTIPLLPSGKSQVFVSKL